MKTTIKLFLLAILFITTSSSYAQTATPNTTTLASCIDTFPIPGEKLIPGQVISDEIFNFSNCTSSNLAFSFYGVFTAEERNGLPPARQYLHLAFKRIYNDGTNPDFTFIDWDTNNSDFSGTVTFPFSYPFSNPPHQGIRIQIILVDTHTSVWDPGDPLKNVVYMQNGKIIWGGQ